MHAGHILRRLILRLWYLALRCFLMVRSKPPWRALVLETPTDFLLVWSGDYLDARWYIEPVDPTDGIEGATGFWIYDPISWLVGVGRE